MKIKTHLLSLLFSLTSVAQSVTVTNTNDSGAGSLRDAILTANANWSIDTLLFNIPTSDPNYNSTTGVFTIQISSRELPVITNRNLLIDGSSQTVFTSNTNTTVFGTGGVVGVDALPLSTVDGPEIEIVDASANGDLKWGLELGGANITVQDIAIHSFGNTWFIFNQANLSIRGSAHKPIVRRCVLGSQAAIDAAPIGDVNGAPKL
jgi:hypothetical protein